MADSEPQDNSRTESEENVGDPLEDADSRLFEEMASDARLQSGVPENQRSSDLDFIQMTGLTRPEPEKTPIEAPAAVQPEDMDFERPVSFSEKGVADVDPAMAPRTLEDGEAPDEDIIPEAPAAPFEEPAPPPTDEIKPEPGEVEPEPPTGVDLDPGAAPTGDLAPEPVPLLEVEPDDEAAAEPEPAPDGALIVPSAGATESPRAPERPPGPNDLAEAEQLLQELEEQPRSAPVSPAPEDQEPCPPPSSPEPPLAEDVASADQGPAEEPDEAVYRQPLKSPRRRRAKRVHGHSRRRVVRWGFRLATVAVVLVAGYFAFRFGLEYIRPYFETPEVTLADIRALEQEGEYSQASGRYTAFARMNPDHPARADAQFQAAFCMQMAPAKSFDEDRANKQRALRLFGEFRKGNPSHQKALRAKVLTGLLNFRLEHYEKAVELLRDPTLRLKDPDSALPALRTLARAYTQLGEYDRAVSAHLQAASMNGNCSPDVDYVELGNLYRLRADRAQNDEDRKRFQEAAVEQWTHAILMPGIDQTNKIKIREKRDWLLDKLGEGTGVAGGDPAPTPGDRVDSTATGLPGAVLDDSAGADAVETADSTGPGPGVAASSTSRAEDQSQEESGAGLAGPQDVEPDPRLEAEHLGGTAASADSEIQAEEGEPEAEASRQQIEGNESGS